MIKPAGQELNPVHRPQWHAVVGQQHWILTGHCIFFGIIGVSAGARHESETYYVWKGRSMWEKAFRRITLRLGSTPPLYTYAGMTVISKHVMGELANFHQGSTIWKPF
jgi:hypothetical protein